MWNWKLYLNCCILIGLGFKVYPGASLECFQCAMNRPCSDLDIAERPESIKPVVCFAHEVCFKNVVMDKEFHPDDGSFIITKKHISRGCKRFDPQPPQRDSLGCELKWRKDEHAQEYLSCMCNDTNYCNGVQATRSSGLIILVGLSSTTMAILLGMFSF